MVWLRSKRWTSHPGGPSRQTMTMRLEGVTRQSVHPCVVQVIFAERGMAAHQSRVFGLPGAVVLTPLHWKVARPNKAPLRDPNRDPQLFTKCNSGLLTNNFPNFSNLLIDRQSSGGSYCEY